MSEYYPDRQSNTIYDKLDVVVRLMDGAAALSTAANHPGLLPDTHGYDPNPRGKYIRVWAQGWTTRDCQACRDYNREHFGDEFRWCDHRERVENQRMVCFFVEKDTGLVWKAAGWKAPALNFPRGNINDAAGRWAATGGKLSSTGYYYGGF